VDVHLAALTAVFSVLDMPTVLTNHIVKVNAPAKVVWALLLDKVRRPDKYVPGVLLNCCNSPCQKIYRIVVFYNRLSSQINGITTATAIPDVYPCPTLRNVGGNEDW
jgi:hypothetical protein